MLTTEMSRVIGTCRTGREALRSKRLAGRCEDSSRFTVEAAAPSWAPIAALDDPPEILRYPTAEIWKNGSACIKMQNTTSTAQTDQYIVITARDIAEQVGVSISTVGRALADDPRISIETRAKVQRAAERAGYTGNMPAKIMRGGSSNIIGLLVPEVRNDFYAAIAQSLSVVCDRAGYRLVLSLTADEREIEARHVRELAGARAAGVIIVPTRTPRKATVQLLQTLPHVQLLRRVPALNDIWFGIDDHNALSQATEHLVKLGHRRLLYVGGSDTLSTGASRLAGFRQGARQLGLSSEEAMSVLGPPTQEFGASVVRDMVRTSTLPTAVLTGSVNITIGLIREVEAMSIATPGDLSIVGFGDPEWFQWWRGGLTSIRPPIEELATSCGLWFLDQLGARRPSQQLRMTRPHHALVTSSFRVRRTTSGLDRPVG